MLERIAVIEGYRTPMGKMGGKLANYNADILGSYIIREIYTRYLDYADDISEVIIGNVAQPAHAANIARIIALRSSIPNNVPAYTVHRNCASGLEAITSGICKILSNQADTIIAGGVESMSNIPFLFDKRLQNILENLARARTINDKIKVISKFRLSYLKPKIGLKLGLTDPICNLIMGDTAEILARQFNISRKEQDEFAARSHNKAQNAEEKGIFKEEIIAFPHNPKKAEMMEKDEGIRYGQNIKALSKLKPFFDRKTGTVTAGNSSQITDGAAGMIIMRESKAKSLGIEPLGYIKDFTYSGLDPKVMGLGPAYAISSLLNKTSHKVSDIDLFEINEAFAAQVIACLKALDSKKFCIENLGQKNKIGDIDINKVNVNGGSIALGHPVGMTGARVVIHALRQLKRQGGQKSIASLCIGGGQGAAIFLEAK